MGAIRKAKIGFDVITGKFKVSRDDNRRGRWHNIAEDSVPNGWTQDDNDPANVDSHGGDLEVNNIITDSLIVDNGASISEGLDMNNSNIDNINGIAIGEGGIELDGSSFSRADFVENDSTIDQLRDVLIASGLMKSS